MAAESDDQKGGDEAERRAGRDRRRPPLTIDLTAEKAAGKAEAVRDSAPQAEGTTAPPRTAAGSAWPNFARFAPRNMDRETWIGVGSAAALGGVVALVLLMLLQGVGVMPSPGASAARQASDQARAASDTLASIERRLKAVETMTEGLPGLRADVSTVAGRIGGAEQAIASGAATAQALRTDLTALRARADQAPPSAAAADLAALSARVARLEGAASSAGPAASGVPGTGPTGDADPRIALLTARLEAAEATIARLGSAPSAIAGTTAVNARAVALTNLRRAVDAGRPFGPELDALAAFGPDAVATGLRPYAVAGVATREAIRADFAKVGDAILVATQPATDDSLFGRLVSGARGLVSIKPVAPIAGSDPPAIVSRMDAAVAKGDLAAALRERDGLPAAGKDASADWAARASARIAADTLLVDPAAVTGAVNR